MHPYKQGERYRVIKPGAKLWGLKPIGTTTSPGYQGWATNLEVGTILTCDGEAWTFGDGVPIIKWRDADGNWIANDCEFKPSVGSMWSSRPDPSYLERIEE